MPTFLRVLIPVLLAALAIALALPRPPPDTIEVSALEQDLQVVDSLVDSWVESEQVPGAVLLVSRGGEILLERAYGSAATSRT